MHASKSLNSLYNTTPLTQIIAKQNMKRKSSLSLGLFFLLLIAFASRVVQTEARVCQSQSHRFRGGCWGDHNCALVCRNEGFSGGRCRGFRRRCFCTRLCN
ncbi:defensin-like protein [Lotus japonicus]|uniref:defensin-like protein n=1 Tax=Lotus japonicus TaxID=34305 RepID=UPI0025890250|nr:defensin-like protein [Lotus japonicus]